MTNQERQEMEALRARVAELEASKGPKITAIKVSEKGGLSVYGIQRFPVTLYADGWKALIAGSERILKAIEDNAGKLSHKKASASSTDSLSASV